MPAETYLTFNPPTPNTEYPTSHCEKTDLLHSKRAGHRHRSLLGAQQYDGAALLTKYSSELIRESQHFANHRAIRLADGSHGSVNPYMGKW